MCELEWRWSSNDVRCVMHGIENRITVNPVQCGGRPCIRGMRIRVTDVLDLVRQGCRTRRSSRHLLPRVKDIEAAIRFAGRRVQHPVVLG